jgi:FkbM family methyltransferase
MDQIVLRGNLDASAGFEMPRPETGRIRILDIGANPIGGDPPYAKLLADGRAEIIGFEPNPAAFAMLQTEKGDAETYLPHAVGDGGRHVLHICQAPGMTSLLEPDPAVLQLFHGFPDWGRVLSTKPIDTVRLDDLEQTRGTEMIKIDIQGAELMVLQNATDRLATTLLIQTEVEFLPLYRGQPLFAEVDSFLRSHGFMLHRFFPSVSRVVQPLLVNNDVFAGLGQIVWADAVFIRDLTQMDRLTDAQLIAMATLLHYCYRSVDVALHLLGEHDRRTGGALGPAYLAQLQRDPLHLQSS